MNVKQIGKVTSAVFKLVLNEMSFASVFIRSIDMKQRPPVRPSRFANLVIDVIYSPSENRYRE
jgi:hypothetical protein